MYIVLRLIDGDLIIFGTDDSPDLPKGSIGFAYIFDDYESAKEYKDRYKSKAEILKVGYKDEDED